MGYKEFMSGLFEENLTFLEGMLYSCVCTDTMLASISIHSTGDCWNNIRSTLERVFSHESAMKSVEDATQYEYTVLLFQKFCLLSV